jgi:hypothetical protein
VVVMMVVVVVVVAVMGFCRRIFFWHTFRRWVLRPRSDRRKGDSRGQKYRYENFLYHFFAPSRLVQRHNWTGKR